MREFEERCKRVGAPTSRSPEHRECEGCAPPHVLVMCPFVRSLAATTGTVPRLS